MKAGAFFSASAWGALAVAAIGLATPTMAAADPQDGRRGDWSGHANNGGNGGGNGGGNNGGRAENRGSWRQDNGDAPRARPAQAPVAAPQQAPRSVAPAPHSQWGQGEAQARMAQDRARAEAQRNALTQEQRRGAWSGRDGNQDRSGTWNRDANRDRDRDGDRTDRRGGDWNGNRTTDRNGTWNRGDNRWSGDRDGNRDRDHDYRHDDRRNYRDWDRNSWRHNDRYDWRGYREGHRSTYRIGRYYAPYYGYSYRRIGIGFTLGSLFYGNRYWIDDPWSYRLPDVYGPYRWVRYYDDVLLVDIYTGEVVDVIYDFFW